MNEFGVSPLWEACNNASAEMVDKLVTAGANTSTVLRAGETALMRCARTGNAAAVKALLAHKADVNVTEPGKGQTALMWALEENHPAVAAVLIESGAECSREIQRWFYAAFFCGTPRRRRIRPVADRKRSGSKRGRTRRTQRSADRGRQRQGGDSRFSFLIKARIPTSRIAMD